MGNWRGSFDGLTDEPDSLPAVSDSLNYYLSSHPQFPLSEQKVPFRIVTLGPLGAGGAKVGRRVMKATDATTITATTTTPRIIQSFLRLGFETDMTTSSPPMLFSDHEFLRPII